MARIAFMQTRMALGQEALHRARTSTSPTHLRLMPSTVGPRRFPAVVPQPGSRPLLYDVKRINAASGEVVADLSQFSLTDASVPSPLPVSLCPELPTYHVTPPGGWLNDPNGPVFYNGKYHL